MFVILSLLGFAVVLLTGWAAFASLQQRRLAREALVDRLQTVSGPRAASEARSLLRDPRLSRIPALDTLLRRIPIVPPVVRMVRQAGLRKRVGEVLLYIPLLAGIGFLGVEILGGAWPLALAVGTSLGLLPLAVVSHLRRKRTRLFAEQLPEALDLIRAALQAGHGLMSALSVVVDAFPDPIAEEFRLVVDETRLGLPLRDALYNLAARVPDGNLPVLVVGILIAQEVGGNLAEVTENIAHTIRERAKLERQTQVMTAQGRLSGGVLTALPFVVAALMYFVNPTYFRPMVEQRTGHYLLGYALVSVLYGHFVIRRLVRIKV
jgi:tight adherence protein B